MRNGRKNWLLSVCTWSRREYRLLWRGSAGPCVEKQAHAWESKVGGLTQQMLSSISACTETTYMAPHNTEFRPLAISSTCVAMLFQWVSTKVCLFPTLEETIADAGTELEQDRTNCICLD